MTSHAIPAELQPTASAEPLQASAGGLAATASVHAETSAAAGSGRIEGFGWLRLLAALDTLSVHLTKQHALGGAGLPLFLMLTVALSVAKPAPGPTSSFVRGRVKRLLLPWLFWCGFFTLDALWVAHRRGAPTWGWVEPAMLWYGPQIHLWFLPFCFVLGAAAHLLHRRHHDVLPLIVCTGSVAAALALLCVSSHLQCAWPYEQWLFSLPALPLGFALGRLLASRRGPAFPQGLWLTLGFVALAVPLGLLDPDCAPAIWRYALALAALSLVGVLPLPRSALAARFAPLMLGVYVLHLWVYVTFIRPWLVTHDLWKHAWLRVAFAFPITLAVVAALRRTPLRRVL